MDLVRDGATRLFATSRREYHTQSEANSDPSGQTDGIAHALAVVSANRPGRFADPVGGRFILLLRKIAQIT
jgi:hypothetical protein